MLKLKFKIKCKLTNQMKYQLKFKAKGGLKFKVNIKSKSQQSIYKLKLH